MIPENHPPSSSLYNSTAEYPGFHKWNSPIPYLFGGLALMLGLIALALIMLACSFKKTLSADPSSSPSTNHDDNDDEKPDTCTSPQQLEMEPRFLVIMAGDHNPTYIAMPSAVTAAAAAAAHRIEEV